MDVEELFILLQWAKHSFVIRGIQIFIFSLSVNDDGDGQENDCQVHTQFKKEVQEGESLTA